MADAGVAAGLSRDVALRLAIATVEGAAGLVRETGIHPESLKDSCCVARRDDDRWFARIRKSGGFAERYLTLFWPHQGGLKSWPRR